MRGQAIAFFAVLVAADLASAQQPTEMKIGVFDAQRISEETNEGKRVQAYLNDFKDKKMADLAARRKEVEDLQKQLQAQALSLSPDKRSALEKDIQKKLLDLNQAQEAANREMQLELSEAQSKFQEQLMAVVEQFGRDEGFSLLLEKSVVAFADNALDVTTALVDRFNRLVPAPAPPAKSATPAPAEKKKDGT
jgi:outer membrane protein